MQITTSNRKNYQSYYPTSKSLMMFLKIISQAKYKSHQDYYIYATQTSWIFRIQFVNLMQKLDVEWKEGFY